MRACCLCASCVTTNFQRHQSLGSSPIAIIFISHSESEKHVDSFAVIKNEKIPGWRRLFWAPKWPFFDLDPKISSRKIMFKFFLNLLVGIMSQTKSYWRANAINLIILCIRTKLLTLTLSHFWNIFDFWAHFSQNWKTARPFFSHILNLCSEVFSLWVFCSYNTNSSRVIMQGTCLRTQCRRTRQIDEIHKKCPNVRNFWNFSKIFGYAFQNTSWINS